jgi:hypothetical protein
MGFLNSNVSESCPITFAKILMSSENPEIRHLSITDFVDTEHATTNIAASPGEEEKTSMKY